MGLKARRDFARAVILVLAAKGMAQRLDTRIRRLTRRGITERLSEPLGGSANIFYGHVFNSTRALLPEPVGGFRCILKGNGSGGQPQGIQKEHVLI